MGNASQILQSKIFLFHCGFSLWSEDSFSTGKRRKQITNSQYQATKRSNNQANRKPSEHFWDIFFYFTNGYIRYVHATLLYWDQLLANTDRIGTYCQLQSKIFTCTLTWSPWMVWSWSVKIEWCTTVCGADSQNHFVVYRIILSKKPFTLSCMVCFSVGKWLWNWN